VSGYLKIPTSKIYAVATFYDQFRFTPRAKYRIKICSGTACHITGAESILSQLEKRLNIKAGETSKDAMVSLEISQCIGACGLAPVVLVNDTFYAVVTAEKIDEIVDFVHSKVEN
jgi:NADH-quinone oxidoreductase subunit E